MRYQRKKEASRAWYGLAAAPEDSYGYWTCPCGHVVRRGEDYCWRGGELRCEKCLNVIKMVLPVRIRE